MTAKAYRSGTHRTVQPSETLLKIGALASQFGITRIANVTGLDRVGIPVVMVVRPNSRSVAVSQGKGLDLASAKASGLMEAIETWHAERISHALKLASYAELRPDHAIVDLDRLPKIPDSLFHTSLPMLWIEGQDLINDRPVWLPYETVHTNYTLPRPTGSGCFHASTNGLASGNHVLEATSHAICEVIERDSTTILHELRPERRAECRVDLDTIDDPDCRQVLAVLADAGLETAIWDTTTDVGVASFYCVLMDDQADRGHMGAGAGCHPAKGIALSRALTEAVQTRTTYIAGSRDDLGPEEFSTTGRQAKYRHAERMMAGGNGARDFRRLASAELDSFEQDIQFLLDRLSQVGVQEVVTVDLSKPQVDIPVIRVVIPGLEAPHDDDTYLPGPRALSAREA